MATVKQIFEMIQVINPSSMSVSSMGRFVTPENEAIASFARKELAQYLPESSLAYKIISSSERFSEKQIWVIAFELVKNAEYCEMVDNKMAVAAAQAAAKKARSAAKLAGNKAASADVLAKVKEAGKLLKDYYAWLKKSQYKKEFFSKKFTEESVNAFLTK